MILLDQMIRTRRLYEFVSEMVRMHNEEMEDTSLWETWLHKVFDKGFAEFKKSLGEATETAAPTKEETESIVKESYDLLAGFVPDEGLVNSCDGVSASRNDSG